eukprot:gene18041-biopygen17375
MWAGVVYTEEHRAGKTWQFACGQGKPGILRLGRLCTRIRADLRGTRKRMEMCPVHRVARSCVESYVG